MCTNIINLDNNQLSSLDVAFRLVYTVLAIISMIGLCVVALSIFYNKQLGEHPSPLIARICIVEAIMSWNSLFSFLKPKIIICYFDFYVVFAPMSG